MQHLLRRLYLIILSAWPWRTADAVAVHYESPPSESPPGEAEPDQADGAPQQEPTPQPRHSQAFVDPRPVEQIALDIPPTIEQLQRAYVPPPPQTKAKWVKPKGLENLKPQPARAPAPRPSTPRAKTPRPVERAENPEKWGQYYFRDAILDQLDLYFIYLRRMRARDPGAYELHSKLGIQIVPPSTVQNFDDWRYEGTMDELDAWWKEHRPSFGAVSYGIDRASLKEERLDCIHDASPETMAKMNGARTRKEVAPTHRIVTLTAGDDIIHEGEKLATGIIWVPRFLYFTKFQRPPPNIQQVADGDVYLMTVYWDRLDDRSKKWRKTQGKKGGIPQEYAVCVDKTTGRVRLLKMFITEMIKLRHTRGYDRGKSFSIPNNRWSTLSNAAQSLATGRLDASPEDYLRRLFIEAALMYESAALGSMIRVEVKKGNMAAVFGVEAKRMSYFFKDRDVTLKTLTANGRRQPIFHIIRPHMRQTKKGEVGVRMHFKGLRKFDWAGYRVSITVPGLDHFAMPEVDIGIHDVPKRASTKGYLTQGQTADFLLNKMREGLGQWKPNGQ